MKPIRNCTIVIVALILAGSTAISALQENRLPAEISDAEFWRIVSDFSEPDAPYRYENLISNEASIQKVIPLLLQLTRPDGVYLGVAPEQNFTYIFALKSKIAFVIDIRRQNMLELLVYKALFEASPTRADFVGKLFSRKRPSGLDEKTSAASLFTAYEKAPQDDLAANLQALRSTIARHGYALSSNDLVNLDYIYLLFAHGGPSMTYDFGSVNSPGGITETFAKLMTATDRDGHAWSFLASEQAYQYIREMQRKNLIIPIVGDFAGPKALRSIGQYLKDHNAPVTAFYVSNVEFYLEGQKLKDFHANVAALPLDSTSMFIRWIASPQVPNLTWYNSSMGAVVTALAPMSELVELFKAGHSPSTWVETLRAIKDPAVLAPTFQEPTLRRVSGRVGKLTLKANEILRVELVENVRGSGLILQSEVSPDGSFEFRNVQPKTYQAIVLKTCKSCDYSLAVGTSVTVVVSDKDVTELQLLVNAQ